MTTPTTTLNVPFFSQEQTEWLTAILTPECCHITGERNSSHSLQRLYICNHQKAEVLEKLTEALCLQHLLLPDNITAKDGCCPCQQRMEKNERRERVAYWRRFNNTGCPFGHGPLTYFDGGGSNYVHDGFFRCESILNYRKPQLWSSLTCGWRINILPQILNPSVEY